MANMPGWNLKFLAINGKQGLAALTNEKEDIFDQIHANNIVKRSGVHIHHKKYKKKISGGASEKVKNLPPHLCRHRFTHVYFCPPHSNPSRDLVLLIQEEIENLYKIPKRRDVKFLLKAGGHKKLFRSDRIAPN
jgi:hypothetical protein